MKSRFEQDPNSGAPRILFVGKGDSSHTYSWIDLLCGAPLNVRLFALPGGIPPPDWKVRTYLATYSAEPQPGEWRRSLYPRSRLAYLARWAVDRLRSDVGGRCRSEREQRWLASAIEQWQPHLVHVLGLDPAGDFTLEARQRLQPDRGRRWILQLRGGSDLALSRLDPLQATRIGEILRSYDQILSDNPVNFGIARGMGVGEDQLSRIGTVPGTGGIDVDDLAGRWCGPPSQRRIILVPKTYESPWSKSLPVLEAIRVAWREIRPCRILLLAVDDETRQWARTLPEEIRAACGTMDRVPRAEVLDSMLRARVMLAPSLVDGTPNSMWEAMAAGAFPIVSPLETITPICRDEEHTLFARNLYPEEIARALVRAMNDDLLVDGAARSNLALVRRYADRGSVRSRVVHYYQELAEEARSMRI